MKPFLQVCARGSEVVSFPAVSASSQFHLSYCYTCVAQSIETFIVSHCLFSSFVSWCFGVIWLRAGMGGTVPKGVRWVVSTHFNCASLGKWNDNTCGPVARFVKLHLDCTPAQKWKIWAHMWYWIYRVTKSVLHNPDTSVKKIASFFLFPYDIAIWSIPVHH